MTNKRECTASLRCRYAAFAAHNYQLAGRVLSALYLFDTRFGQGVLDVFDWFVPNCRGWRECDLPL